MVINLYKNINDIFVEIGEYNHNYWSKFLGILLDNNLHNNYFSTIYDYIRQYCIYCKIYSTYHLYTVFIYPYCLLYTIHRYLINNLLNRINN